MNLRILGEKINLIKILLLLFFFIVILIINKLNLSTYNNDYNQNNVDINTEYDKWIILLLNNSHVDLKFELYSGFRLIIIGNDEKFSNHTDIIYLNEKNIKYYKYYESTGKFDSSPHALKNIAYLHAIRNGAQFIYDTNHEVKLESSLINSFNYKNFDYGLIYDGNMTKVNIYSHFGQPDIWPRGYSTSNAHEIFNNIYTCGRRNSSYVQNGILNGYSDIDFNLKIIKSINKDFDFDTSLVSIQIPTYKIAPFNSMNTLFSYEAFWGLYMPKTVKFEYADIVRSYWLQRLLWLIDGTVTFYPPNANRFLNNQKDQNYYDNYKLDGLIEFLYDWKCDKKKFYDCVMDLSLNMAFERYWDMDEVSSIKKWINDLNTIGYNEPLILNFENKGKPLNVDGYDYVRIRYTPNFGSNKDLSKYCCNGEAVNIYEKYRSIKYFVDFCHSSNFNLSFKLSSMENNTNSNTTLLVTFNFEGRASNIEFIQNFYADYFKNIIFCGKDIIKLLNSTNKNKKFDAYTFIELDTIRGYYHYFCMNKVLEMNINTNGILLMSDDVLLKYWNLNRLDINKIWYPYKFEQICNNELKPNNPEFAKWPWWNRPVGARALFSLWDYFNKTKLDKQNSKTLNDFLYSLDLFNSNKTNYPRVCVHGSDIFYLPKVKFKPFYFISGLFRKFGVFLEIAVPTILAGLTNKESYEYFNGTYSWFKKIDFQTYDKFGYFAHPIKLSQYFNLGYRRIFCEKFIQDKFRN